MAVCEDGDNGGIVASPGVMLGICVSILWQYYLGTANSISSCKRNKYNGGSSCGVAASVCGYQRQPACGMT